MPRNGSGTYSLPAGNPVVTGTVISSTVQNNTTSDIATALTNSIAKDGQTTPTANLPMGGFKLTGLGTGSAATDSANLTQIQAQAYIYLGAVAGTDTITGTTSPVTTAYAAGQTYRFVAAGTNTGATTININSLGAKSITKLGTTALAAGDILINAVYDVTYDGTQFQLKNQSTPNILADSIDQSELATAVRKFLNSTQDFRLTLTSAVPVTTADVTAATTIYCTPYKGNSISLYDGTNWNIRTSSEFSLALGTLTSGRPYDVFCYDNAGTPTLEFTSWSNDTSRATSLTSQDGVLVKTGALTRRYLGTFYTTATTTTEDSLTNRYLWNFYHRVKRPMQRRESTASWTYTTAAFHQANASTANQLNYVCGRAEDDVMAEIVASAQNSSAGITCFVAVGIDSTTVASGIYPILNIAANSQYFGGGASYSGTSLTGRHFIAWLEYSTATGTTTWSGTASGQSGIVGTVWG